jgi:hypothetical protein
MIWPFAPTSVFCLVSACAASAFTPQPERGVHRDTAAFEVGINVSTINWWDGSRPFSNLIYGTGWQMQNTHPWSGGEEIPDASLDPNGWVRTVPSTYRVTRGLSVPVGGGKIVCRYQGNGTIEVAGPAVSNVRSGGHRTSFTLAATYPDPQPVTISFRVDSTDYIRNIDCREEGVRAETTVAPEFQSAAAGFKVIRFMKWQSATESNTPVNWATRNKADHADYTKRDGVPIEVMMETANRLQADPWFTIPWNADADYVARFAIYVRDHLAPGHRVYVETGNEVWNSAYPVYQQACDEARSEGLHSAEGGSAPACADERYAEKTRQVMAIWSNVFAGRMDRLVRVFAYHHLRPYGSDKLLAYQDAYKSVDALATAPYFGHDVIESMTGEEIMAALPAKVDEVLDFADRQKAVARKYGLRYITYEAGQHIVFRNNLPLLKQVQADPRMQQVYARFISGWKDRVGDTLTLFALTGGPSQYGSWGAVDYAGQPLSQTPKMRAIRDFLGAADPRTQK